MNVIIDTADGPRFLTPHEAQQRIAQLEAQLQSITLGRVRSAIQREIDGLQRAAHPELAYEGWT